MIKKSTPRHITMWAVAWKTSSKVLMYGAHLPAIFFTRKEAETWKYNSGYKSVKIIRYMPGTPL